MIDLDLERAPAATDPCIARILDKALNGYEISF
jgi:hypothetical protein